MGKETVDENRQGIQAGVGTALTDGHRHISERITFLQGHFSMLLQSKFYGIKFTYWYGVVHFGIHKKP